MHPKKGQGKADMSINKLSLALRLLPLTAIVLAACGAQSPQ
jgi:hypothetical protein